MGLFLAGVTDVRILEAGAFRRERVGESVPPDFRRLLARMGLLEEFLREGHSPCLGSRAAWGQDALGYNDFIVDPQGPGWHLDRSRFERFLAREVERRGIGIARDTRCREVFRTDAGGFLLKLEAAGGQQSITADFVVDAGGLQAPIASRLGARRRVDDQMIVAAVFVDLSADANPFDGTTLLEAAQEGWWYTARLPAGRAVIAFSCDAETLRARRLDQRAGWKAAVDSTRHVAPLLEGATWRHERPIRLLAASSLLEPCAGEAWLAVGDAASSFDPLSAQGLHKAFSQGLAAADALAGCLRGDASALAPYRRLVEGSYAQYWQQRSYFYGLEQRWPTSPFWRRRQAAGRSQKPPS